MGGSLEMVKAKVTLFLTALALVCACSTTPKGYSWEQFEMDGHRTGVSIPTADNIAEALGVVSQGVYTAPNGRVFKDGCTPEAAALLIEVQPEMAALKEVVGYSRNGLFSARPESVLSNFIVDNLAEDVAELTGKKVDVAIMNFGGIRTDIPSGDILLDNIQSMLPFKNYGTWLSLGGRELRAVFEQMAATRPQCISGARVVVEDGRLRSVMIGGKPLDDNKIYGVATIDFLVDGGDGYKLARGAREMIITDKKTGDMILEDVRALTAAGKSVDYFTDGRYIVKGEAHLSGKKLLEEDAIELNLSAKPSGKERLLIMHCNDTHSHMDPVPTTSGLRGGVIERAAFVDSIRAEYPASKLLLLHAGDFNQGTSYYTQMEGMLEAKLANAFAYDCIALGNHELDDGIESLAGRLAIINSSIVCANCEFPDTLQQYVQPYAIFRRGGMKIGIIGLESDIATMVSAPIAERIAQLDNVEVVNKWAEHLKKSKRCDMIILLSHLGYKEDQALIPQVSGIDLVIGGHSHTFVDDFIFITDADGKSVPIITDGCWGINMGLVKVY